MIKNGRRPRTDDAIAPPHTFRTTIKVDASALSVRRDRRRRSFCRFAIPISDWGNFFFKRPPRFKSERELNIVVWKQRCGLFFASKMHDKQRQRFSVKAPSFFRTPSFESICIAASASVPVLSFSMDFFCIAESPITPQRKEGGTFSEFQRTKI